MSSPSIPNANPSHSPGGQPAPTAHADGGVPSIEVALNGITLTDTPSSSPSPQPSMQPTGARTSSLAVAASGSGGSPSPQPGFQNESMPRTSSMARPNSTSNSPSMSNGLIPTPPHPNMQPIPGYANPPYQGPGGVPVRPMMNLPPRPPPGHYNGPVPPQQQQQQQWGYHGSPEYNGYAQPYPPGQPIYSPQPGPLPGPEAAAPYYQQPDPYYQQPMYGGAMPPPPPPPQTNAWRPSPPVVAVTDNYLADSSVPAANAAGRRIKKNQFPPPTKENLARFRAEAKKSNDPQKHLDLAKYLLEAIPQICANETDPKRARRVVEVMNSEAEKIVRKLASQSGLGKTGYTEAQFFLANCYSKGEMGLEKDAEKAFALYMQGAKQNHPACTYRVAVCYEVGAGTKRDNAHAIQYYRKAANLADVSAMYKLGMILLKGLIGQSKNPPEGISWLKRATLQADEDHPHAFHELGLAYEKEGIPSVIPDVDYARELFTQAAQFGYAPSQFKLGLAYENGFLNCPVDPRRSIAWYSKAAEQGHLEAELSLSGWYLTGAEGVLKQSDEEAYLWARKAADKGYSKAEYAVGYYTETGIGVRQNLEEAKKWYMRAAAQNNRRAMHRLMELKKAGANRPQQRRKHTRAPNGQPDNKDGDCVIM